MATHCICYQYKPWNPPRAMSIISSDSLFNGCTALTTMLRAYTISHCPSFWNVSGSMCLGLLRLLLDYPSSSFGWPPTASQSLGPLSLCCTCVYFSVCLLIVGLCFQDLESVSQCISNFLPVPSGTAAKISDVASVDLHSSLWFILIANARPRFAVTSNLVPTLAGFNRKLSLSQHIKRDHIATILVSLNFWSVHHSVTQGSDIGNQWSFVPDPCFPMLHLRRNANA